MKFNSKAVIIIVVIIILLSGLVFIFKDSIGNIFQKKPPKQDQPIYKSVGAPPESSKAEIERINAYSLADKSIRLSDLAGCNILTLAEAKNYCLENVVLKLAFEGKDPGICLKAGDNTAIIDRCQKQVAESLSVINNNLKLCSDIRDANLQKSCLDNFYNKQALIKSDVTLCDKITAEKLKASCKDAYLFEREFKLKPDSFDCNLFLSATLKADCVAYQGNKNKQDRNFYTTLQTFEFRAYSYEKTASSTGQAK